MVFLASTMTNANGKYIFDGLCAGQHTVSLHTPTAFTRAMANQTCDVNDQHSDETDSDCDYSAGTECEVCIHLSTSASEDLTIDCDI